MFIKCKAFFYALYLIFITNKLGQYCHHQYMNEYTESWEIQTIRLSPPESGGTRIQTQVCLSPKCFTKGGGEESEDIKVRLQNGSRER